MLGEDELLKIFNKIIHAGKCTVYVLLIEHVVSKFFVDLILEQKLNYSNNNIIKYF